MYTFIAETVSVLSEIPNSFELQSSKNVKVEIVQNKSEISKIFTGFHSRNFIDSKEIRLIRNELIISLS